MISAIAAPTFIPAPPLLFLRRRVAPGGPVESLGGGTGHGNRRRLGKGGVDGHSVSRSKLPGQIHHSRTAAGGWSKLAVRPVTASLATMRCCTF